MTDTAKPTLRIVEEVVSCRLPNPTNGNPCLATFYGTSFFSWNDRLFAIGGGGYLDHPFDAGDANFVDKGFVFEIDPVTLKGKFIDKVLGAETFHWNTGGSPEEDQISSVASPRVFPFAPGSRRMGALWTSFAADAHKSTGVHNLSPASDGGSLIRPWSRSRAYMGEWLAAGPDRATIELYAAAERSTTSPQGSSFAEAFMYHEPLSADLEKYMHDAETGGRISNYQGLVGTHSALWVKGGDGIYRLYVWCEFRRDAGDPVKLTGGQTQYLTRTQFGPIITTAKDGTKVSSIGIIQEIWNGLTWEAFDDRAYPQWVNTPDQVSGKNPDGSPQYWPKANILAHIASSIDETHVFGGSQWIVTCSPGNNGATMALSDDTAAEPLTRWKDLVDVQNAVPGSTWGQPNSCMGTCYTDVLVKPMLGFWRRPAQCTADAFAGLEFVIGRCETVNAAPIVVVPPVVPPVDPPAPTLPYPYTVPQPLGTLDETLLTTAHGYARGDQWFVSGVQFIVMPSGQTPLFGTWLLKGVVR